MQHVLLATRAHSPWQKTWSLDSFLTLSFLRQSLLSVRERHSRAASGSAFGIRACRLQGLPANRSKACCLLSAMLGTSPKFRVGGRDGNSFLTPRHNQFMLRVLEFNYPSCLSLNSCNWGGSQLQKYLVLYSPAAAPAWLPPAPTLQQ